MDPDLIYVVIVPHGESPGWRFISEDHHARGHRIGMVFGPAGLLADGCRPDSLMRIHHSLLSEHVENELARYGPPLGSATQASTVL